ncbi:hypothetical protein PR048_019522 [Dryococelus australis]|uniref:Integrase catalytic domain-containing protein n=1 Tax=Dryococelus australis TaxID=614101 RepID=A0ABQ9H3T9_9NEOP|nr:hypothetical protein PR048_019522 [Dryococelus australis]
MWILCTEECVIRLVSLQRIFVTSAFRGKQIRKSFKSLPLENKPNRILEVVSSDVIGPIIPQPYDSKRYIVTFIDNFSYFAVVYLLSYKSNISEKFEVYEAMITAKFGTRISHNGGQYISRQFIEFYNAKGIQIEYTIPRNPELNGLNERCMLLDSKVEKKFWGEAVCAATYVLNRTPTRILKEGCPADLWYGYCDSRKITIIGTAAYTHIPKEYVKAKLDPRSKPLIMMSYTANRYRWWDNSKWKIVTACSVKFLEEPEPYNVESKAH